MEPHTEPAYRAAYGDTEFRALLTAIFAPGQEWAERLPHIQTCIKKLVAATAQGTFLHTTPMAKHKAPYLFAVALTAVQLIRPNQIGPDEYARLHALLSWRSGYRSSALPSLAGAESRASVLQEVSESRALVPQLNHLVYEEDDPRFLFPGMRPGNRSGPANPYDSEPRPANPYDSEPRRLLRPGNRSALLPRADPSDLVPRVKPYDPVPHRENGFSYPWQEEHAENGFSYPWQEEHEHKYYPGRHMGDTAAGGTYAESGLAQAKAIAAAARKRASEAVATAPVALAPYVPLLAGAVVLGGVTYAAYRMMSARSSPEAVQMRDTLARATLDAAFEKLRAWPDQPQSVRIPAFLDLLQEQGWHTEAMDALLQVTGVALQPEVYLVFTRPRGAPPPGADMIE